MELLWFIHQEDRVWDSQRCCFSCESSQIGTKMLDYLTMTLLGLFKSEMFFLDFLALKNAKLKGEYALRLISTLNHDDFSSWSR